MEEEEDREFLDLLEKEESETQKAIRIPEELETGPTKLDWKIKLLILLLVIFLGLFTLFTYKILNPPQNKVLQENASPWQRHDFRLNNTAFAQKPYPVIKN